MGDDSDLNPAKVREVLDGDLQERNAHLHPHTGHVPDDLADVLSFGVSSWSELPDTDLYDELVSHGATSNTTEAVHEGRSSDLAFQTGVTEADLDGSNLRLPLRLVEEMDNNGAPAFIGGAGNPNSGKTTLVALFAELRSEVVDDLLVISNSRTWPLTDVHVMSAHDLACALIEHRDRPKFVFLDEGSTLFDARTFSREVAIQFTPLAKRFAKIGVDVFATVGHTGKDLHPEVKRLITLAFYKLSKKEVEFYADWPADADHPVDRLFGGSVDNLEPAEHQPDPDDAAPWSWDLQPELFSLDLGWSELLDELRERGPAE